MVSTVTVENAVDTGVGTHVDILSRSPSFPRVTCDQIITGDATEEARAEGSGGTERDYYFLVS